MSSASPLIKPTGPVNIETIEAHLCGVLRSMLNHDGYADLRIESRILKRGQKELILHFGHQYRFVVDLAATGQGGMPSHWEEPGRAPGLTDATLDATSRSG
jgi:hypothetical protein